MKSWIIFFAGLTLVLGMVFEARSQDRLGISGVGRTSKIKLVYGKRSAVVDLEDALSGTNGSLPGNPPHIYRVLFTARKEGYLYMVANVRSRSPISSPNAACGGDSPQAVLWIKADKTLKTREFQSYIYQSCSYNYYKSKMKLTKNRLAVSYKSSETKNVPLGTVKIVRYENSRPDEGLKVSSFGVQ